MTSRTGAQLLDQVCRRAEETRWWTVDQRTSRRSLLAMSSSPLRALHHTDSPTHSFTHYQPIDLHTRSTREQTYNYSRLGLAASLNNFTKRWSTITLFAYRENLFETNDLVRISHTWRWRIKCAFKLFEICVWLFRQEPLLLKELKIIVRNNRPTRQQWNVQKVGRMSATNCKFTGSLCPTLWGRGHNIKPPSYPAGTVK